jgi:hypothetical protein
VIGLPYTNKNLAKWFTWKEEKDWSQDYNSPRRISSMKCHLKYIDECGNKLGGFEQWIWNNYMKWVSVDDLCHYNWILWNKWIWRDEIVLKKNIQLWSLLHNKVFMLTFMIEISITTNNWQKYSQSDWINCLCQKFDEVYLIEMV